MGQGEVRQHHVLVNHVGVADVNRRLKRALTQVTLLVESRSVDESGTSGSIIHLRLFSQHRVVLLTTMLLLLLWAFEPGARSA